MKWHEKEYALYKGETCLDIGTIPELHKTTGKTINFLRYMTRPIYKKRTAAGKNRLMMELIEEDEE